MSQRKFRPEDLESDFLGRLMAHEYWAEAKHLFGLDAEKSIVDLVQKRAAKDIQDIEDRRFLEHIGRIIMEELKKKWTRMTKKQLIGALVTMKIDLDSRPTKELVDRLSKEAQDLRARVARLEGLNTDYQETQGKLTAENRELKAGLNLEKEAHRALVRVVNRLY